MDVNFFWRGVSKLDLMLLRTGSLRLEMGQVQCIYRLNIVRFFFDFFTGDSLYTCEQKLIGAGLEDKLPLFRVFFKILSEFQAGENSPWYSWLNSLPRIYNTGASMTYACFDCLPPYAAYW